MGLDMNYKAEVFVDTENLSREDWLSFRRKGIGGSDAAAIMGMSPFSTKRDLYYDKLGIQPVVDEEEDNWVAKEVGHRLEDLVAEIFSRKTGLKVYPVRKMFRHPLQKGSPLHSPGQSGCPVRYAGLSGRYTPYRGAGACLQGRPGKVLGLFGAVLLSGL